MLLLLRSGDLRRKAAGNERTRARLSVACRAANTGNKAIAIARGKYRRMTLAFHGSMVTVIAHLMLLIAA